MCLLFFKVTKNLPLILALLVGIGVGDLSGLAHVVLQVLCLFIRQRQTKNQNKKSKGNNRRKGSISIGGQSDKYSFGVEIVPNTRKMYYTTMGEIDRHFHYTRT